MALVSPGLELSVTDESQYVPGAVGSVPLVLLATAQDKTNPSGTTASGTTATNAGRLQVFTSQRELVSAFGNPTFYQSAAGTSLHGDERNEYGLMAAYSTLGVGNRVYAIRADVDTAALEPTAVRPTGTVANGTNWLDLASTNWGVYEWDAAGDEFVSKTPLVVTSLSTLTSSVGDIGTYAVALDYVSGSTAYDNNDWELYYKNTDNDWVAVGDSAWKTSHPTIKGTVSNPSIAASTPAANISVNGTTVTIGATGAARTVSQVATAINSAAITGVTAAVNANNQLEIYATDSATNDQVVISNVDGTPLTTLGISIGTYNNPAVSFGTYVSIPAWRSTDDAPRPSGSVYLKTSATGAGADVVIKKYSSATDSWTAQAAPLYASPWAAVYGLDASGGGANIAAGSMFVRYNVVDNGIVNFKPYSRIATGAVKTVGSETSPVFTSGDVITVEYTTIGSSTFTSASATLSGTNAAAFVTAILGLGVAELTAAIESSGAVSITHRYGGVIRLTDAAGDSAVADAGFDSSVAGVVADANGSVELTGFAPLTYTYSSTEPTQNPDDGTLWYYGTATVVDIMINDGTAWVGYQNVSNDSRGYNLTNTDPGGVIVSASKPTTQTDNTALVAGDLWLDTSDLENWPAISRYNGTRWVAIDNTDQIGPNGILFADARWDTDGTTDVINGTLPSTVDLLTSDYTDLDCPDPLLSPRGMLLFNTRRSGYNVKRFVSNYFNDTSFPDDSLPTVKDAWVSASGLKDNGSMYAGYKAQRNMIVQALKAAVDGSTDVREDQYEFNLIVAPGYPELIQNMVSLNNDRANTAFVIGDTPFRLAPSGVDIVNWSNNTDNSTGLTTNDPYLGVYYPGAALTNDVQGNSIVVPSSHIALRTMIRSDNVSYQWFAPAGTRRGLVDNASSVGYISATSGEYVAIGVNQGLRDSLYENKINPITNLPGVGLVVWGQKTRNPTASSLDRINVARLVNYIRTILAKVGNGFLFEPNDKITRDQIKNIISGAINDLVSKRGIYDYLVVCDESNNTTTRIARNELYVDIAIEPMKDVEFIYIPIRLYNPGDVAKLGA